MNNEHQSNLFNKSSNTFEFGAMSVSLDDIYANISLYEYQEDDAKSSRRITWEEWYLRKKIQALKNEKLLREKMKQVYFLFFDLI